MPHENHDLAIAYKLYKKGIIKKTDLQFITYRYFSDKYSLIFNNVSDSSMPTWELLSRLRHFVHKLFESKI